MKKNFYFFLLYAIGFNIAPLLSKATTASGIDPLFISEKNSQKNILDDKKKGPALDSIFVIKNKKFSYYNNWITFGIGKHQNFTYGRKLGFAGGVDFNFHVKKNYYQIGLMMTGDQFRVYDNYEFHLGRGIRFEDKDFHTAIFGGISCSKGYKRSGDSIFSKAFTVPGVYAQAEIVKKITYDVGIGGSLYIDWNKEQTIFGARLICYFSGAYKGKKFYDGKNPD